MKCQVCGNPMTQLFVSWACDYCDGKKTRQVAIVDYARSPHGQEFWVALFGPNGKELSHSGGYRRVKIELLPSGQSTDWWGDVKFPTATDTWDVDEAALMDAQFGGSVVVFLDLTWGNHIQSGSTLTMHVSTQLPNTP